MRKVVRRGHEGGRATDRESAAAFLVYFRRRRIGVRGLDYPFAKAFRP